MTLIQEFESSQKMFQMFLPERYQPLADAGLIEYTGVHNEITEKSVTQYVVYELTQKGEKELQLANDLDNQIKNKAKERKKVALMEFANRFGWIVVVAVVTKIVDFIFSVVVHK